MKAKKQDYNKNKLKDLINLIFKVIALAMGVAVIVLDVLNQIEVKNSIVMLGIGLFCIGIYLLNDKKE